MPGVNMPCFCVSLQAVCFRSLHRGVHLVSVHRADLSLLHPGSFRCPSLFSLRGLPQFPADHQLVFIGTESSTLGVLLRPFRGGEPPRWVFLFLQYLQISFLFVCLQIRCFTFLDYTFTNTLFICSHKYY